MTESTIPDLPESFVERLKEIIPAASGEYLYSLLAGSERYSHDVLVHLDSWARYLADKLDDSQKATLKELTSDWKASGYTPPPPIAVVELFISPTETEPDRP